MGESRDHYIRRHNVENYRRQLLVERDESQREMILKLLAEELQKQSEAGDTATLN
jgi:hypothetical protein